MKIKKSGSVASQVKLTSMPKAPKAKTVRNPGKNLGKYLHPK